MIIASVRISAVTTSVPDAAGNNFPIVIIVVVVFVALLIIVIILVLIGIYAIWRKHQGDERKLENSKRYYDNENSIISIPLDYYYEYSAYYCTGCCEFLRNLWC